MILQYHAALNDRGNILLLFLNEDNVPAFFQRFETSVSGLNELKVFVYKWCGYELTERFKTDLDFFAFLNEKMGEKPKWCIVSGGKIERADEVTQIIPALHLRANTIPGHTYHVKQLDAILEQINIKPGWFNTYKDSKLALFFTRAGRGLHKRI